MMKDFFMRKAVCILLLVSVLFSCNSKNEDKMEDENSLPKLFSLLPSEKTGIDFIICHYPPYTSKWNPIEHRLFAHVHRAMQGVIFTDYNIVKELIAKTKTRTGLKVFVRLNIKEYPIGIKTDKSEVDFNRIQLNDEIPALSYRIAA